MITIHFSQNLKVNLLSNNLFLNNRTKIKIDIIKFCSGELAKTHSSNVTLLVSFAKNPTLIGTRHICMRYQSVPKMSLLFTFNKKSFISKKLK